jgi:hypothetical protein
MKSDPRWVIFPGERTERALVGGDLKLVTMGTIYVVHRDRVVDKYECAGGPRPGHGFKDKGGHTGGATPSGDFVLDRAEHHVTMNWPASTVPWGANIREREGIIEFQRGGIWHAATGPHGAVTRAQMLWQARSGDPATFAAADAAAREAFFADVDHHLITVWLKNDFGKWSWNLRRHGKRTAIYVHTTPDDELAAAKKSRLHLDQSHGCLHIQPADRDAMIAKKYLRAGVAVRVMHYGRKGPPRPEEVTATSVSPW